MVILSRALQGFGASICFVLTLVMSFELYPDKTGFVMGIFSSLIGIFQAIGPSLGGVILHFLSWRMLFLINVPSYISPKYL